MKLNPNSIPSQTSNKPDPTLKVWEHPWNAHMKKWDAEKELEKKFKKPNPPSQQAVERAKFVDKTYQWAGSDSVRSGNKRAPT